MRFTSRGDIAAGIELWREGGKKNVKGGEKLGILGEIGKISKCERASADGDERRVRVRSLAAREIRNVDRTTRIIDGANEREREREKRSIAQGEAAE